MKSAAERSFYVQSEAPDEVLSTPATAGPWSPSAQHGGPPSGLLTRALAALLTPDQVLSRISVDLLGPVPVGPLRVTTAVERPGRSVTLLSATLHDVAAGRGCAVARAWVLPRATSGPGVPTPLPHSPADGAARHAAAVVERRVRRPRGVALDPRRGRCRRARPPSGCGRGCRCCPTSRCAGAAMLMTCVDSASGVSAALDPAEWAFLNTEITVHLLREPVGDWVCVDAETTLGPGSAGIATAAVYDERGLVARSAQGLLVTRRG